VTFKEGSTVKCFKNQDEKYIG